MGYKVAKEDLLSVIPHFEDLAEILSDGIEIVSVLKKTRKMIVKNKIQSFINFLEKQSNQKIKDFLNSIKDSEDKKTIFLELLNKTIDLDDSLQFYLLAQLLIRYKQKGQFNYWEKSLYYNIKLFSEDDYMLLFNFIKTLNRPLLYDKYYGTTKESDIELNLTLIKFETIGILTIHHGGFAAECINLEFRSQYITAFKIYPFTDELCSIIDNFLES